MIALVLHSDCIVGYWFDNSNGIFAYQLLLFWNKYSPTSISFDQTCEEDIIIRLIEISKREILKVLID